MKGQLNKFFFVALALLFGAGVIMFAWRGDSLWGTGVSTGEGSSTWKDALRIIPGVSSSKTLGIKQSGVTSVAATTTTDKLARELLVDYALLQKESIQRTAATTTLSDTDAQVLAQALIDKVEVPKGPTYTLKNLTVSSDNSDTANTAYAKKVSSTMNTFNTTHTVNELSVVTTALSNKDAKELQKLPAIAAQYNTLTKNLLAIPVPSSVAPLHLHLVQWSADTEAATVAMGQMFTDPVRGLAALIQYKKEVVALDALGKEYRDYTPTR